MEGLWSNTDHKDLYFNTLTLSHVTKHCTQTCSEVKYYNFLFINFIFIYLKKKHKRTLKLCSPADSLPCIPRGSVEVWPPGLLLCPAQPEQPVGEPDSRCCKEVSTTLHPPASTAACEEMNTSTCQSIYSMSCNSSNTLYSVLCKSTRQQKTICYKTTATRSQNVKINTNHSSFGWWNMSSKSGQEKVNKDDTETII